MTPPDGGNYRRWPAETYQVGDAVCQRQRAADSGNQEENSQ